MTEVRGKKDVMRNKAVMGRQKPQHWILYYMHIVNKRSETGAVGLQCASRLPHPQAPRASAPFLPKGQSEAAAMLCEEGGLMRVKKVKPVAPRRGRERGGRL